MPRSWTLALVGLAAILTTSCGSGTPSGSAVTPANGTEAAAPMRPMGSDDSIALLADGNSLRQVDLSNVYVPVGGGQGTIVEIHPTAQPLMVRVPTLPAGGSLLVCPMSRGGSQGTWARTSQPCIPVTVTTGMLVKLDQADGNTHVAVEFSGTWKKPVTLKSVSASYTAVDDHFYVDFAIP